MKIRAAQEADLDQITAIYAHHVRDGLASFEEIAPSLETMSERYRGLVQGGYPYLVAAVDESPSTILGYASAGPYRTRPAYRFSVENSVYVDESGHRRGVGSGLLAALIDRCAAGVWRQMVAVIGDSENRASIRLHETQGFRHVGTIAAVGYKHGRWVDSVIMQRALGSGDNDQPEENS